MLWNGCTIDETKGERICDGCGLVAVENVALDVSGNGGYANGDSAGTTSTRLILLTIATSWEHPNSSRFRTIRSQ